jgi:hypothetical protein
MLLPTLFPPTYPQPVEIGLATPSPRHKPSHNGFFPLAPFFLLGVLRFKLLSLPFNVPPFCRSPDANRQEGDQPEQNKEHIGWDMHHAHHTVIPIL